jgi:hypothetical protein
MLQESKKGRHKMDYVKVVFDMEGEEPEALGTYVGTDEDSVEYRTPNGRHSFAPVDCVKVVAVSFLPSEAVEKEIPSDREILIEALSDYVENLREDSDEFNNRIADRAERIVIGPNVWTVG